MVHLLLIYLFKMVMFYSYCEFTGGQYLLYQWEFQDPKMEVR